MTGFPKPPKAMPLPSVVFPPAPKAMPPVPLAIETKAREKMNHDDINFILETNLVPDHFEDPTVLGFMSAYINCRDVKQASREIGILTMQGKALLNRPDIATTIGKITSTAVMKHNLDPSEIVEKAKEIMQIDPIECMNDDGTFKESLVNIAPETRRAIRKFKAKNLYETDPNGMKVLVGRLVEVEFWDKPKMIQLLGQEKSLFKETKVVEHGVTKDMKNILLESKERGEVAALEATKMKDVVIDEK